MARVLQPLLSSNASGMCGPLVGVRGRRGSRLRGWANPCDPRTSLQTWNRRRVWAYTAQLWLGVGLYYLDEWEDFAARYKDVETSAGVSGLSARQWFFRFMVRSLRYGLPGVGTPPPSPGCSYSPDLGLVWTGSGAELSWTPAITGWDAIVVRQARNEPLARLRPVQGTISHIFRLADSSPQLITPGIGGGGGPGDLPPIYGLTSLHVHVWCLDQYGRFTPTRYWRLWPA